MKLFENFERLKSLILNKQQIFAFDYFKKRDLSELNKNKVENLQELYKYLKGMEFSENHNLISDENIIYLLDQDIKNFFSILLYNLKNILKLKCFFDKCLIK